MPAYDDWGVDEVASFLTELKLDAVVPAFKENGIEGKDLAYLTDEDLVSELGCKPLQAKKIRRELDEIATGAPPAPPSIPAKDGGYPNVGTSYGTPGMLYNPNQAPSAPPANAYVPPPVVQTNYSYENTTRDTNALNTADLQQYKQIKATMKRLETEQVDHKAPMEQASLAHISTSMSSTKQALDKSLAQKAECEKLIAGAVGKHGLRGKMARSKAEGAERQLGVLQPKIDELQANYDRLKAQHGKQSQVVAEMNGKATELEAARKQEQALIEKMFNGLSGGDEEENRLEYSLLELKPKVAELQAKQTEYKQAYELMGSATKMLAQSKQKMEQAFKSANMDVVGNFFTPGPGVQGPMDLAADVVKRRAVQESSALVERAGNNIARAQQIIPEMPQINLDVVKKMPGMIMDLLVDNMFTDMRSRGKIKQSIQQIEQALQECNRATQWMGQKLNAEVQAPLNQLTQERDMKTAQLDSYRHGLIAKGLREQGLE